MGDSNKQICRLCLVISPTCECETIDEIKKEILEVLQININLDISDYAVACNGCLERLQDCFDFKSHIITIFMDNIKKTSQQEVIGESLCLEKLQVCWLCMSLIKEETYNYTADLKGADLLEDMIRNCFPEMDLNTHVHGSHICKQCISSLERYYEFFKNCQEVEQKIAHFCQVAGCCIADKVNLEDMLKFKEYDMLGTPLIIKKECSDTESVDVECPKSEEIASIRCEETHIKDDSDAENVDVECPISEEIASIKCEEIHIKDDLDAEHVDVECPINEEIASIKCEEIHIKDELDNGNKTSISKKKKHKCHYCDYETPNTSNLKVHVSAIHKKGKAKVYYCQHCAFKTLVAGNLGRHVKIHEQKGLFKCPCCKIGFNQKSNFENHLLKNHDSLRHLIRCKIHYCKFCTFETVYLRTFICHMARKHNIDGAEKFQCDKCDYFALEKAHLIKHLLVHSKLRPYLCTACHKRFNRKDSLDSHILSKHKENADLLKSITYTIHQCTFCTFETINSNWLGRHMKSKHKQTSA